MAVRNESVRLSLDDAGFSTGMAKAAAATAVLDNALDDLDGSTAQAQRSIPGLSRDVDGLDDSFRRSASSIDRYSGRLGLILSGIGAIGPALVPIGAVAIPAITGLASQLGFAGVGMASLVAASQGVGDALKAVNDAALEPTAANLEKAGEAMERLGPEAQAFVRSFQDFRPVLTDIRDAAAAGWFPGLTESLDHFEDVAPRVATLFEAIGETGGRLVAEGAEALAGPEWAEFIDFVTREAPPALEDLGRSVGNVAKGMAEMWMAFAPLNQDFSSWMLGASRDFARWADGLSETQGFQEFVAYIRENGPKVADAASAIGNALVQIVQAAAPLGGPVLEGITTLADALAAIADSELGTPIMAFVTAASAAHLATKAWTGSLAVLGATAGTTGSRIATMGKRIGIAAVALEGLEIGGDVLDSWNSYKDIGDQSVKTTEDLVVALAKTDLGKYADDFGISLQSLAEDLVKNGESGEYFQEVIKGFHESQGTLNRLSDSMNPFIGDSEKAAMASLALQKVLKEYPELVGAGTVANEEATVGQRAYTRAIQHGAKQQELLRARTIASRDAARDAGKAFLDFSDAIAGDDFSLDKYLSALEDQVRALAGFRDNIQTLRERGLSDTVIDELIAQGPAAAQAVEGLAESTDGSIKRLNKAVREGRSEVKGLGKDAKDAETDVNALGNVKAEPKADLRREAFDSKMKAMERDLGRVSNEKAKPKADLEKAPFDSKMQALRQAVKRATGEKANPKADLNTGDFDAGVSHVRSLLASLDGDRADTYVYTHFRQTGSGQGQAASPNDRYVGGYTGDGGKYEPAGIVHRGEVVIPQEEAQRDAPMLRARYGHLPGMDQLYTGGLAGYANGGRVDSFGPVNAGASRDWWITLEQLTTSAKGLDRALKQSEKSLDKERKQRDAVRDKMRSLSSDVTNGLRSDIFGGGEWSAGSPLEILRADIRTARGVNQSRKTLQRKGVDGDALAEILASGNPNDAAMMAAMSRSQLAEYERLFKVRNRQTADVGAAASVAAYGKELAIQTRELRGVKREVRELKGVIRKEERENRRAARKGAGNAARSAPRGRTQ